MRLYGVEVPTHVIDHALSSMDLQRGFTCGDLEVALARAGVSDRIGILNRCADRTLQKLRKKGAIRFDGVKWKAVEPST